MKRMLVLAIVFSLNASLAFSLDSGWTFIPYPKEISDGPFDSSDRFPLAVDQNKIVWLVDLSSNIWAYSNDTWRKYPSEITGMLEYHWSIFVDSNNRKWFASSSGSNSVESSILRYDGNTWKTFALSPIKNFRDISEDRDGVMWCAGEGGVGRINPDDTWQVYRNDTIGVTLPDFFSVCVDKNNVKWFSYGERINWTGGVVSYNGMEWKQLQDSDNIIGGGFVSEIVPLKNGKIALSLAWRKILFYDGESFRIYSPKPWDITVDRDDNLWVIVWDDQSKYAFEKSGVIRHDGHNNTWFAKENSTSFTGFLNIAASPDNSIWMTAIPGLWHYRDSTTGVSEAVPSALPAIGNSPNPFNPSTTIRFTLPQFGKAELAIYSITGQRVRTLVSGALSEGAHSVAWDGRDDSGKAVSSGVYLSRLSAGKHAATGKMVLLR